MIVSHARVRTEQADQYLHQLSYRSPNVDCGSQYRAVIIFPVGRCELTASAGSLELAITANSIFDASMIEDAISERLDSLAVDEELHYQWVVSPEAVRKMGFQRNSAL